MVFHEAMYKKIPYAPADPAPVGFMARFPLIVAVNPAAGFTDAKQWLDAIKKNPASSAMPRPASAARNHLAMELLKLPHPEFSSHVLTAAPRWRCRT